MNKSTRCFGMIGVSIIPVLGVALVFGACDRRPASSSASSPPSPSASASALPARAAEGGRDEAPDLQALTGEAMRGCLAFPAPFERRKDFDEPRFASWFGDAGASAPVGMADFASVLQPHPGQVLASTPVKVSELVFLGSGQMEAVLRSLFSAATVGDADAQRMLQTRLQTVERVPLPVRSSGGAPSQAAAQAGARFAEGHAFGFGMSGSMQWVNAPSPHGTYTAVFVREPNPHDGVRNADDEAAFQAIGGLDLTRALACIDRILWP